MAEDMRLADEVGQGLARFQPLAVDELEHDAVEDGNRCCEGLRKEQCGGEGHRPEHTVIKPRGTGISRLRSANRDHAFMEHGAAARHCSPPARRKIMDQKYIDLFDRYTHGQMKRRDFLERLTLLAGGTAAATALLPALENNYAKAEMVAENDTRILPETITYESTVGKLSGYLVKQKEFPKAGGVIVISENRGLNPHIKDVARRLATEGFLALAPDYLSVRGGTPGDEDKARELIGT